MLTLLACVVIGQQNPAGLVLPHTAKVEDVVTFSSPAQVKLGGLLGDRYTASERARLPQVDENELLSGFRNKPGKQAWIGEHVGKWLHAASLTYLAHHDSTLRAKMDRVAAGLMATQEADGYLGTYPAGKRFSLADDSDWDVWVHKYCLLGLLTYYQATQNKRALVSSRRIGDLLVKTFTPGGRLLSKAGQHEGMAATSVLEPIVLLYSATGDSKYLQFGRRIVESFNEPEGSHLERDLLTTHSVAKTANGKAYEMLSNLVGLTELFRATGDVRYLKPAQIAWQDIVSHRLYLTGTGSSMEVWTKDGVMPHGDGDNVGETCVTVTWIQLNLELLRLTGDSKYMDQVERSLYNHLLGSQRADGAAWCYYSPLNGSRHPGSETNCCLSSGPRGIALIPVFAYASQKDGVDVNLYGDSAFTGSLRLRQTSSYPFSTDIDIRVERGAKTPENLRLRIPAWVSSATVRVDSKLMRGVTAGHYFSVRRIWKSGDRIHLHFPMPARAVNGTGSDSGSRAFMAGPLVFAADASNALGARKLRLIVSNGTAKRLNGKHIEVAGFRSIPGGSYRPIKLSLIPYFQAGTSGSPYAVWLPSKQTSASMESLFDGGEESQSRAGNVQGSFADGDPSSLSVTFNAKPADEDWFAVVITNPVTVNRIVYRHGAIFHDGGWFDTSAGKPQIQVMKSKGGSWETIGTLDSYPTTDATHAPSLDRGQAFEFRCPPTKVVGIRIVGTPSHGDNPAQSFSSCAELEAFGK